MQPYFIVVFRSTVDNKTTNRQLVGEKDNAGASNNFNNIDNKHKTPYFISTGFYKPSWPAKVGVYPSGGRPRRSH